MKKWTILCAPGCGSMLKLERSGMPCHPQNVGTKKANLVISQLLKATQNFISLLDFYTETVDLFTEIVDLFSRGGIRTPYLT